jgi:hypothetical protein
MDKEDASVRDMAALLTPISNCAELLNRDSVEGTLSNCMDRAFKTVETLDDKVGGRAPRLIFAYSPLKLSVLLLPRPASPVDRIILTSDKLTSQKQLIKSNLIKCISRHPNHHIIHISDLIHHVSSQSPPNLFLLFYSGIQIFRNIQLSDIVHRPCIPISSPHDHDIWPSLVHNLNISLNLSHILVFPGS